MRYLSLCSHFLLRRLSYVCKNTTRRYFLFHQKNVVNTLIYHHQPRQFSICFQVWSPFRLPSTSPSVGKDLFKERPVYSHEDYINLVLRDGSMMTHDYTEASTEEDPRMIAFFDSLVQRELEGWSSDDTLSSNEEEMYSRIVQLSSSDTDSTISSISSLEDTLADIAASGVSAEENHPQSVGPSSRPVMESVGSGISRTTRNLERPSSPHLPSRKRKKLSKLIKKKKEGLKDNFYRNRSRLTLTSSSDSSSDEENISTGARRRPAETPVFETNPVDVQNIMKKKQLALKESFVKLKRLRTLRNQILNSDSDTEISVGTKVLEQNENLNEEKDRDKEFKSHHKTKKHTETSNLGPYVHEMCHMFEASSSCEPQVCSSNFKQNVLASSTSTNCGCTDKCSSFDSEISKTFNTNTTKHSPSDSQNENQYHRKWRPLDESDNSCISKPLCFHNKSSCDSNQINLTNNKLLESELLEECDNTESKKPEDKNSVSDTDIPGEVNVLENIIVNHEDKSKNAVDQNSIISSIKNNLDSNSDYCITSSTTSAELHKFYDSLPSCSAPSVSDCGLSQIDDNNADSSEISRVAWTEFKKRKNKSEHSKKHYRSHKRSERQKSRD